MLSIKTMPLCFTPLLSPYFNAGLLDPLSCIQTVERKYHESNGSIPLNSVEGFIRQSF